MKIGLLRKKNRNREKYHRLNYKDKEVSYEVRKKRRENYITNYPEKYKAKIASQRLPKEQGCELHHWSYNEEHYKDVLELSISDHNLLHRFIVYDQEIKMYRDLNGNVLNKGNHLNLIKKLKETN